jgi:ferredoxin
VYYNVSKEKGELLCDPRKYKEDYIMAYVITDDCVMCGACADACPVEAISEGDGKYVIDADVCAECGTCVAECPNEAIVEA